MPRPGEDVDEILRKYGNKLETAVSTFNAKQSTGTDYSREYVKFKDEMSPEISRFERWCKSLGNVIKLKISEKDAAKINKDLQIAHLDLEPWQPVTLSVMAFLGVLFIGLLISLAIFLIRGATIDSFPLLFFFVFIKQAPMPISA